MVRGGGGGGGGVDYGGRRPVMQNFQNFRESIGGSNVAHRKVVGFCFRAAECFHGADLKHSDRRSENYGNLLAIRSPKEFFLSKQQPFHSYD